MSGHRESQTERESVERCCVCDDPATRRIVTRGLEAVGQTLYCDRHYAELLALSQSVHDSLRAALSRRLDPAVFEGRD